MRQLHTVRVRAPAYRLGAACSASWRNSVMTQMLCASRSIQDVFLRHAELIWGITADCALAVARMWLYTTPLILPKVPGWPETSLQEYNKTQKNRS
eukprot:6177816-Pleurochrysis_carterae.AAC.4